MSNKHLRFLCIVMLIGLACHNSCLATLNMQGNTSYVRVSPGANFVVSQPINSFSGKLIRDNGGIISGSPITFSRGLFEDSGNDLLLSAILDLDLTDSQIQLTGASGSNLLRAQPGTVYQNVVVSGDGNRIEGSPFTNQNIVLTDAATAVTMALQTPLNSSINLNNGTISLDSNLAFADNKQFIGSGIINANNHEIIFGGRQLTFTDALLWSNASAIELWSKLILSSVNTFTGMSELNGNGNIIQFNPGGQIRIGAGGVLSLTDVVLKNFGNTSFAFDDVNGEIIMSNVTIELAEDVTTTLGTIYVEGPATWIVKDHVWNFSSVSSLTVDGVTLWGDFAGSTVQGDITYGPSNLTLLNTGTIKFEGDYRPLESRVEVLETCCDENRSRIEVLETCCDESRSCCQETTSRIEVLETCCDENRSRIEVLETCCDESRSCCENLDSRVESLESRVDEIEKCVQCECVITITGDTYFNLGMLPAANAAAIFRFTHCLGGCPVQHHLIFDPAIYGNGGVITLPSTSRIVFDGEGIVELKDGVIFTMGGTYGDPLHTDWPAIITQNLATMHLDENATVTVNGVGCFTVRSHGTLLVDEPGARLLFGGNLANDEIAFKADFDSNITINDPTALISFNLGTFDLIFDNHSMLHILQGVLEFNMLDGVLLGGFPGYIRTWYMINGSELDIRKIATGSALLRVAPNLSDLPVDFDNRSGFIRAGGDFEYKLFNDAGTAVLIDSVCQIQSKNITISTDPMSEIFRELCYKLDRLVVKSPDVTILCIKGTRPDPSKDGCLAAFLPNATFPNGSIVGLQQGDHDVCYDRSTVGGALDQVRGANRQGIWFTISNGNEATRVPPVS